MEFHPYADVWPLMEGVPFDELVTDIKANGLIQPIVTYQDMILDGRNRYRACEAAGVAPVFMAFKGDEKAALLYSNSLNRIRRHMSVDALAFTAAQQAKLTRGQRSDYAKADLSCARSVSDKPLISIVEAAESLGVSPAHAARARTIMKHAPELKEAVLKGKTNMTNAADEAAQRARVKKFEEKAKKVERQPLKRPKTLQALNGQAKLTRQQVDPEWTGNDMEWVLEYGLVHIQTSQQRSTSRLSAWAIVMGHLVKVMKEQELPKITDRVVHWLRSPSQRDVARLREAVAELDEALQIAKRLLARAEESTAKKSEVA